MTVPASGAPGRPWAVIAGGGTAGHILPALAIARELVERGRRPEEIHFVGSAFGQERELVPAAGFSIDLLPGRGLTGRKPNLTNLKAALGIVAAALRAVAVVRRLRPRVVVSVGGFAAFPAGAAAVILRIPLVLAESNAIPGAVNRILGRFAKASAVAFPGTGLRNEVLTGNPVRAELVTAARTAEGRRAARAEFGIPENRVLVVAFGGSLGSRRINEAVLGYVRAHGDRSELAIRHAIGRRDWAEESRQLPAPSALIYQAVEYEDRMPLLLSAADLAVTRAGGSTLSELAVVGLPSILVPLPIAHRDHQTANAEHFVRAGAAVRVADNELTPERLATEIQRALEPGRLAEMAAAARTLSHPEAGATIAALVEKHARD